MELLPGDVDNGEASGHHLAVANAVELELVAVQAVRTPAVALDHDVAAGDEEVDLVSCSNCPLASARYQVERLMPAACARSRLTRPW